MGSFGNLIPKERKIYGNWQVKSPDGILMFRCDEKKAMWYVNRDLGEIIHNNPKIVKLKFQPNGLGNHHKKYGLVEMQNKCVVCGTDEYLTRHHVVPHCYRKFFPMEIKSHNFHDVLSLCIDCHEKYERKATNFKSQIAEIYDAPINGDLLDNKEFLRVRKLASCLLNNSEKMPKKRVFEVKNEIKKYFNLKKIHRKRLINLINIQFKVINRTHGEIVVSKIDNIYEFMSSWRKHFIENNDCKYLPPDWSIENEEN
jgi:hypothetical protein